MKISAKLSVFFASLLMASAAMAAGTTGIGGATPDDVKLGTVTLNNANWADALAYSGVNPVSGPNGDTSGFANVAAFANSGTGSWTLFGKVENTGTASAPVFGTTFDKAGDSLTFSWAKSTATTGTWSITNTNATQDITIDLVFDMHAANASTAFLFDDQKILKGETLTGTWSVEWLKSGNNPAFSNLALFDRNARFATPVPEPETYGMMLAGLGLIGFAARRRQAK
ncbi:MAG: PEP-CTERM sorting domain-containing protein [Pseudomonadota bacterium]